MNPSWKLLFAVLIFKIVDCYDNYNYYTDYSDSDQEGKEEISDIKIIQPQIVSEDIKKINETLGFDQISNLKPCTDELVKSIQHQFHNDENWQNRMDSEVKSIKRMVKKIWKNTDDLFRNVSQCEVLDKKISGMNYNFAKLNTDVNELAASCNTESNKRKTSNPGIIVEKLNSTLDNFKTEISNIKNIGSILNSFKTNFERVLYNYQNQFWLRMQTVTEQWQMMALNIEECVNLQKEKEKVQVAKKLPEDINDSKMLNGSVTSDIERENFDVTTTASFERAVLNVTIANQNKETANQNRENDDSTKQVTDQPHDDFDDFPIAPQFSNDEIKNSNFERADLLDDNTTEFPSTPEALIEDEVFKNEELYKQEKRSIEDELKFYNVPFGQPRISFEMEQLSKCLEVAETKFKILISEMKLQTENEDKMKKVIDNIFDKSTSRSWMEIGFFILCGFLFGVIIGSGITLGIFLCLRRVRKVKIREPPLQRKDSKPTDIELPTIFT